MQSSENELDRPMPDGYRRPSTEKVTEDVPVMRGRGGWAIRGMLLLIAAGLALVFFTATRVQPYNDDGSAMKSASHETIGLPPCRFKQMADLPCPSCGMTTSFALLVRGDVGNSMRANWVGSGLAVFCALLLPWCVVSAFRGRYLWVQRIDVALGFLVGTFTILMLGRWGVLLLMTLFED